MIVIGWKIGFLNCSLKFIVIIVFWCRCIMVLVFFFVLWIVEWSNMLVLFMLRLVLFWLIIFLLGLILSKLDVVILLYNSLKGWIKKFFWLVDGWI